MQFKKQTLSAIFLLAIGLTGLKAQQATTTSGGNASGSGGSATYSVGQVVYNTNTGAGGTVTQGVQQPFEISVVSGIEELGINISYTAYPNPTTSNIVLEIDASSVETQNIASQSNGKISNETQNIASLHYTLSDINGKQLTHQTITDNKTIIPMEQLSVGTYFITIVVETQNITSLQSKSTHLKTFKIIKQ